MTPARIAVLRHTIASDPIAHRDTAEVLAELERVDSLAARLLAYLIEQRNEADGYVRKHALAHDHGISEALGMQLTAVILKGVEFGLWRQDDPISATEICHGCDCRIDVEFLVQMRGRFYCPLCRDVLRSVSPPDAAGRRWKSHET